MKKSKNKDQQKYYSKFVYFVILNLLHAETQKIDIIIARNEDLTKKHENDGVFRYQGRDSRPTPYSFFFVYA